MRRVLGYAILLVAALGLVYILLISSLAMTSAGLYGDTELGEVWPEFAIAIAVAFAIAVPLGWVGWRLARSTDQPA